MSTTKAVSLVLAHCKCHFGMYIVKTTFVNLHSNLERVNKFVASGRFASFACKVNSGARRGIGTLISIYIGFVLLISFP
jgi:hypothetical protein